MGLFARNPQPSAVPVAVRFGEGLGDVEIVGENYRRESIAALFNSWGLTDGGVKNCNAVLLREPNNPYDSNAVQVLVDNYHVGYVDADTARGFSAALRRLPPGGYAYTPARAWASKDDGTWRARITLRFSGGSDAEIDYAVERRARELADHARVAGAIGGKHWTAFKPLIQEFKKQERYAEALERLEECFAAAVRESVILDRAPDPWPTDQTTIILRKLKDHIGELSALERYRAVCGSHEIPERIVARLMAARVANGGAP